MLNSFAAAVFLKFCQIVEVGGQSVIQRFTLLRCSWKETLFFH